MHKIAMWLGLWLIALAVLVGCKGKASLPVVVEDADAKSVENPEYKSWASFKPGAMAKVRMTIGAAGGVSEMHQATTLVEMSDDAAIVETVTEIMAEGQKMVAPAQNRTVPARVAAPPAPEETNADVETEKGEEEITVAAGTFQCEWAKTTMVQAGVTIVTTVWISPDVPGRLVKMVARSEMEGDVVSTTASELVEFSTGE